MERIRKELEQHQFFNENDEIFKVTGSFGIAQLDADDDMNEIVRKADLALYQSKENGRNKVSLFQ